MPQESTNSTYRIVHLAPDGCHEVGTEEIVCTDNKQALQKAWNLTNGHGVEIWRGADLIGRLEPAARGTRTNA